VLDGRSLARERTQQAVDHEVKSGRVERSADWQRLEDVGLDRPDVEAAQASGSHLEDVRVRVEDGHATAIGKTGVLEEVAGARTDVEVPVTDVLPVALDQPRRRHRQTYLAANPRTMRSYARRSDRV
jgi:hypothetical protein